MHEYERRSKTPLFCDSYHRPSFLGFELVRLLDLSIINVVVHNIALGNMSNFVQSKFVFDRFTSGSE